MPKAESYTFHIHGHRLGNPKTEAAFDEALRAMRDRLGREAPEATQGFPSGEGMRELNARPAKRSNATRTVKVIQQPPVHPQLAATVYILVPDIFGNLEPLIDGETGEPLDFARELGDPRQWLRDRTKDIQAIVERAGKTCLAMLRMRVPA